MEWMSRTLEEFFKQKPEGSVCKKKLLSMFAIDNFSTKRTGKEILDLYLESGKFKLEGDLIFKNE